MDGKTKTDAEEEINEFLKAITGTDSIAKISADWINITNEDAVLLINVLANMANIVNKNATNEILATALKQCC